MPDNEFAAHVAAHLAILEDWTALQNSMMTKSFVVTEILGTIENWIVAHHQQYDVQIKQYL
jgi:hypothetical protein